MNIEKGKQYKARNTGRIIMILDKCGCGFTDCKLYWGDDKLAYYDEELEPIRKFQLIQGEKSLDADNAVC